MIDYLLDSGFFYASIDDSDEHHESVTKVTQTIRGNIILPIPAITETAYFLLKNQGVEALANLQKALPLQIFNSKRQYPRITNEPRKFCENITTQI